MNKPVSRALISIIVPVYKCEKYILDCVTSITKQTYRDLEIILVDDGSPDRSGEICDNLALKDSRIKVIHKRNGGVSTARNAGLDACLGEFVMFVDSDDLINDFLCEHLMTLMDDQCDLAVSSFYKSTSFCLDINNQKNNICTKSLELITCETAGKSFHELMNRKILNCPYVKLFRRKAIGDLRYDTTFSLGEDLIFNMNYLQRINGQTKISSYKGYMYFVGNSNSITNNFNDGNFKVASFLNQMMNEFAIKYRLSSNIIENIDKIFILDTINYFRGLYFSKLPRKTKRRIAVSCLKNSQLKECLKKHYNLPRPFRVLLFFMKLQQEHIICSLFTIKKFLK